MINLYSNINLSFQMHPRYQEMRNRVSHIHRHCQEAPRKPLPEWVVDKFMFLKSRNIAFCLCSKVRLESEKFTVTKVELKLSKTRVFNLRKICISYAEMLTVNRQSKK